MSKHMLNVANMATKTKNTKKVKNPIQSNPIQFICDTTQVKQVHKHNRLEKDK